jgi:serine/threonine-protein kinase
VLVVGSVLIGAILAAAAVWTLKPSPSAPVTRFDVSLPQGQLLNPNRRALAISPDGSRVVYSASGRLYLRSMSEREPRELPGTGLAISPEFSPDGRSIVFFGDSLLKRVILDTAGTATTICEVGPAPASISWNEHGLVFSEAVSGRIMRVSPNGGKPEVLLDLSKSDELADGPQFLPDGRTLLFSVAKRTATSLTRWDSAQVVVQASGTSERKTLIEGGSHASYVPTGHLIYTSAGTVFAVPFDVRSLTVTGSAVPVVEGVSRVMAAIGAAHFVFSRSGSAAYVPGGPLTQHELVVFDRTGAVTGLKLPRGTFLFPRVSADGKRVAFETSDGKAAVISIYDLSEESSPRRLTFGGNNRFPVWSADGRRVTFQSDREGDPALFWQPADGGTAERLTTPARGVSHAPESWSPDGQVLLFSEMKEFIWSLWTFSARDRKVAPFSDIKGSSLPTNATFSPDGRWVAYQVGERGQGEATLYVQPFPATGTRYQIGRGGRPVWSRDGKELFFVPAPGQFTVVRVTTEPTFTFTNASSLPRRFGIADPANSRPYDTLPDGRLLGVAVPGLNQTGSGPAQIHVVLNWFEELKARVPAK